MLMGLFCRSHGTYAGDAGTGLHRCLSALERFATVQVEVDDAAALCDTPAVTAIGHVDGWAFDVENPPLIGTAFVE